jgi:hypothetical protein
MSCGGGMAKSFCCFLLSCFSTHRDRDSHGVKDLEEPGDGVEDSKSEGTVDDLYVALRMQGALVVPYILQHVFSCGARHQPAVPAT